jgi:phosphoglycolate phosphatase-like HAD superfamily hydrolase
MISDDYSNPEAMFQREVEACISQFLTEERKGEINKRIHEALVSSGEFSDSELIEEQERVYKNETTFVHNVLRSYVQWSKDNQPLVLWDIDDTLGMCGLESGVFRKRSSIPELFEFLEKAYPKVQNGILTTRSENGIAIFLSQSGMNKYFETEHAYSTRGLEANIMGAVERYQVANYGFNQGAAEKFYIIERLRETGLNPKWIDDFVGPEEAMGKDGLCVHNCKPHELSW